MSSVSPNSRDVDATIQMTDQLQREPKSALTRGKPGANVETGCYSKPRIAPTEKVS